MSRARTRAATHATFSADAELAVDLSCKAAAGDDLAALGMTLMDRITMTRHAGRDACLVEHDTLRRLLMAAGYGAKPASQQRIEA
jgi:hypothetical protein